MKSVKIKMKNYSSKLKILNYTLSFCTLIFKF